MQSLCWLKIDRRRTSSDSQPLRQRKTHTRWRAMRASRFNGWPKCPFSLLHDLCLLCVFFTLSLSFLLFSLSQSFSLPFSSLTWGLQGQTERKSFFLCAIHTFFFNLSPRLVSLISIICAVNLINFFTQIGLFLYFFHHLVFGYVN